MKKFRKKNFCVVTSSRADYGILSNFLKKLTLRYNTKVIVTGSHLSKRYGYTINEIKKDRIKIFKKVDILPKNDDEISISQSIATTISKFSKIFEKMKIDLLILLGDRYEIFAAAVAASIHRVKIAHIHGGETTSNALDESFRHSITIMSHMHFVSAKKYFDRVVQLGKQKRTVHLVGSLSLANIREINLNNNKIIKYKFDKLKNKKNIFLIYHPETLEKNYGIKGLKNILKVLKSLKNTSVFATLNNADTKNKLFESELHKFRKKNKNFHLYKSLSYKDFIVLLSNCDLIIGNSSSGIIEAPSLNINTLNVGNRQHGRLRANTVYDASYDYKSIKFFLNKALKYKKKRKVVNPYDQKNTIDKILRVLEKSSNKKLIGLKFYDIKK